jgi:class 3 adenylate cyclase/pimeloyl-ACP methyl ester carboxylesterase
VVTDVPETRFAVAADGTNLAYQVSGEGALGLLFVGELLPIDLLWDDPVFVRLSKRLGRFSRTVWVEPRGAGASEGDFQSAIEQSEADILAVLDAALGVAPVVLVGWGIPGGGLIHFSISHPNRVSALVLINSFAHYVREEDYPWGFPRADMAEILDAFKEERDTGGFLQAIAPSRSADERFRSWWARAQRLAISAEQEARGFRTIAERDHRPILGSVSVPTLVMHREGDRFIRLGAGEYLAEHIPGARFVVLPGADHVHFSGDVDTIVDEIEEFVTGVRGGAEGDVVTATVLFTDVAGSTEHQVRIGQRAWSSLTDQHDALVRAALARYRGHEVKTIGDSFLATFDATGRALSCATEILASAEEIGLQLRAGLHTGDVEVRGDDIGGLAVTIAKRICDLAVSGEVLVSRSVTDLVAGSGIEFGERGDHELKGVPGTWRLYAVTG